MSAPPPSTVKDVEAWRDVRDLDENGVNLTGWEIGYVASLINWLKEGKSLTDKQQVVLRRITEDRVP